MPCNASHQNNKFLLDLVILSKTNNRMAIFLKFSVMQVTNYHSFPNKNGFSIFHFGSLKELMAKNSDLANV